MKGEERRGGGGGGEREERNERKRVKEREIEVSFEVHWELLCLVTQG